MKSLGTNTWSTNSLLNTAVTIEEQGKIQSAWSWFEWALLAEKNGGKLELIAYQPQKVENATP